MYRRYFSFLFERVNQRCKSLSHWSLLGLVTVAGSTAWVWSKSPIPAAVPKPIHRENLKFPGKDDLISDEWPRVVQANNRALIKAVSKYGTKSFNVIEPTRNLCWAIHRCYEANPEDTSDLKMSTVLLIQAYYIASGAEDIIDEETKQAEMAAISEQLSATWLELKHPEEAVAWIERSLHHLSHTTMLQHTQHAARLHAFHSTCLNHCNRSSEAEMAARKGIALAKSGCDDLCLGYYELGNALFVNPEKRSEAIHAFKQAMSLANRRGASLKMLRMDAESKLKILEQAPSII